MKNNYKFSIITVTKNSEKFLKRCINSIQEQTYKNFEHIIIDGQSTDQTTSIISLNKNHFSHIRSEKDSGIWEAMNKGIKLATGDIICFLNSDDYYTKDALDIVNKYFSNNNIDFLFGTVQKYKLMHGFYPWKIKWSFGFYTSHSAGFFIKRKQHLQVGFYNCKYLSADLDFFYKMIVKKKLIGMSTSKNEIIGYFEKGGFSSKINFLKHLEDLNNIRLDNGQNYIFVKVLFLLKIVKNIKKVLKTLK